MAELIKRRYAKSLFDLAVERGDIDGFDHDAEVILDLFGRIDDFVLLITNPIIPSIEKCALVEKVFKGEIKDDFIAFFDLTFRKGRSSEICGILEEFRSMVREFRRITRAEIIAAVEMTQTQVDGIKSKLSAKLGKTVEADVTVDPSVIGGVRIMVDGVVIDGTIRRQIDTMKKQLMEINV